MSTHPDTRTIQGAAFLFVAGWFLWHAGAGLGSWFSGDDLMNLYGAWTTPWGKLLGENLLFFGPAIRPLGSLWYRVVFAAGGFHPLPFHIVAFAILLANLAIAWRVAARLTGRTETAALALLLVSYNARFVNLYFDTGAIYDVLCFFFYYAALLWYLRVRQRGTYPGWSELATLLALQICALNSKEMAVTLPIALLAFELVWHPPGRRWSGRWVLDQGRGAIATSIPVALFAAGKLWAADSILRHSGYRAVVSVERAMSNGGSYFDHIFYQYGWFTPGRTAALWLGMLAVALAVRSKVLVYAWLLLTMTILPMLWIDLRAGSAIYVCLFGWALYASAMTVALTDPLRRWLRQPFKGALVLLLVAALLYPRHRFEAGFTNRSASQSGEEMRTVWTALRQAQPSLAPGSRVLFLNDPVKAEVHDLMFLMRLGYGHREMPVDRAKTMRLPPDRRAYTHVLDYVDGRFLLNSANREP